VAELKVSIRLCHIFESLQLTDGGLVVLSIDDVGPDVESYIFKPKADPKDKLEWTDDSKIIYKILSDNSLCKIGSSDQISNLQKLFTFHVGKGNFVDVAKIIFVHLAESITFKKPIIRHGRLLNHMFAQSGLMDAIKPFFPGYRNFLVSSKIINSTTLRYLKLVKFAQIVTPTNPLLLRESEANIDECRLTHVSDRNARKVAEAQAEYLKSLGAKVGSGEVHELTVRQQRMLEQPTRVFAEKRKVVKSPGKAVSKKAKTQAAPKSKAPRKLRVKKIIFEDATTEKREQAEMEDALKQVFEQTKKEEELKDTYESGIHPEVFKEMYDQIPPRKEPLDPSQTIYGIFNASTSENAEPIIETDNDEDSERTSSPPPHPHKYDSHINERFN
jgi:hypothetical protein